MFGYNCWYITNLQKPRETKEGTLDKQAIIKEFLPKAVLIPQTNEAAAAIPVKSQESDMIPIWKFPYRIGRESRMEIDEKGHILVKERIRPGMLAGPTNDIYLIDFGNKFQISRDHLTIEEENDTFFLLDNGSRCGSAVNETRIGTDAPTDRVKLHDGDTVVLGTDKSPYRYTFLLLNEEDGQTV